MIDFGLNRGALVVAEGSVARLNHQLTDAAERVRRLTESTLGSSRETDPIAEIALALAERALGSAQVLRDRQPSRVIAGAVDTLG